MSQLEMFAQNIHLLIGILFACFCAVLLLITFVIGVKITWWQMRRVMAHRAIYGPKRDEQGRLLPQVFRGACTRCGNLFSVVYSVGEHRHLCKRCYRIERAWRDRSAPKTVSGPAEG